VAGFTRNGWQVSTGTGGRFHRNGWQVWSGIYRLVKYDGHYIKLTSSGFLIPDNIAEMFFEKKYQKTINKKGVY